MNKQSAYQYAIKLLTMRDYSCYKMRNKLSSKGYDDLEITEVIEKLIDQRYLNEENYLRSRVKQLLLKSHSNCFIIQKCSQEYIYPTEEFIDLLREEFNLNEVDIVDGLIQKKLKTLSYNDTYEEKQKVKAKVFNFLKTKGHASYQSLDIIEKYL